MNRRFQLYKKSRIILVDDLDLGFEINLTDFGIPEERPKEKYNRAKENREFRKRVDEEWEKEIEDR